MVCTTSVNLILLLMPICKGVLFISSTESTWNDSSTVCTIATPKINYKASIDGNEIIVDYPDKIGDRDGVWVGYYSTLSSFYYFGCTTVEQRIASASFDNDTLRLCFSMCRNRDIIGVSDDKCFCLSGIPNTPAKGCTTGCRFKPNITCGGENHISLYMITSTSTEKSAEKTTGNCLRYEINNYVPNYIWRNCGEANQAICMKNGTDQELSRSAMYTTWKKATNLCLQDDKRTTMIRDLDQENSTKMYLAPSWTGVIRSRVIYPIHDKDAKVTALKFGYLKQTGMKTLLKFDKNASSFRKILCTNETANMESTSDSDGSDVGATVGVSIAVVITVVVMLAIIILILKRRGKLPKIRHKKAAPEKTMTMSHHTSAITDICNEHQESIDDPYNVIVEVDQEMNIDTAENSHQKLPNDFQEDEEHYAHAYFVLENPKLDTENDDKIAVNKDSNNVYNTLNSNIDTEDSSENTYDKTGNTVKQLKNFQDADGNMDGDTDDDGYNLTNDMSLRRTNNDYGVPNVNENEYRGLTINHENDLQNDGDPYDHIGNPNNKTKL